MRTTDRRASALLQLLSTSLRALSEEIAPEPVHKLRTSARRLESALDFYRPQLTPKQRSTLKELNGLRRRAGKVRDLDIQLRLLEEVANRSTRDDRETVAKALKERRRKQSRRLADAIEDFLDSKSPDRLGKIGAQLRRQIRGLPPVQPLTDARLALQLLAQNSGNADLKDPAHLHDLRLRFKKVRYLAELAPQTPEQKAFVADLKHAQDEIGLWHDWLSLAEVAREELPHKHTCSLLAEIETLQSTHHHAALAAARKLLHASGLSGVKKGISSAGAVSRAVRATG